MDSQFESQVSIPPSRIMMALGALINPFTLFPLFFTVILYIGFFGKESWWKGVPLYLSAIGIAWWVLFRIAAYFYGATPKEVEELNSKVGKWLVITSLIMAYIPWPDTFAQAVVIGVVFIFALFLLRNELRPDREAPLE